MHNNLRYAIELIFVEYLSKIIFLKIILAILTDEFSEMANIQYEWYDMANE